jgi:hypothetical protein
MSPANDNRQFIPLMPCPEMRVSDYLQPEVRAAYKLADTERQEIEKHMKKFALMEAMNEFIAEFAAFETHFVGLLLRSLSNDELFAEQTEALLDLEARLQLLKRMAFVRRLDTSMIAQLDDVQRRAGKLRIRRDELRRLLPIFADAAGKKANREHREWDDGESMLLSTAELDPMGLPTLQEVSECHSGTLNLEATLRSIAERFKDRPALAEPQF